jgi:hypothetical protein
VYWNNANGRIGELAEGAAGEEEVELPVATAASFDDRSDNRLSLV